MIELLNELLEVLFWQAYRAYDLLVLMDNTRQRLAINTGRHRYPIRESVQKNDTILSFADDSGYDVRISYFACENRLTQRRNLSAFIGPVRVLSQTAPRTAIANGCNA